MKKTLAVILASVLLAGCGNRVSAGADMSGYKYLEDDSPAFYEMTVQSMKEQIDEGNAFAVYFGFDDCPWCNEAVPVLNQTAKECGETVGYVDTRKDSSWQSNTDIDGYDLFIEIAGEYLKPDEEGVPHLYAPTVIFFRDGKIVSFCEGLVDGYSPSDGRMTEDQQAELKDRYLEGFAALK